MATENSISISIKSSDSEDDISTTELIKNIQNNANCTQILSESENEIDEESWISYMKYLKKNILKDTSPIQKRKKYLNELTLESDEEHMLKNQNYDMSQLHDEDPNELMQEIEKNLNESFFSSMLSIPQGSSSPKLLSHIKSKENNSDSLHEIMSSRIYNYGENPSLNISESIGYHSFKSEHKSLISFSQIKDQLQPTIVDNIKTKNNLIKLSDSEEDVNISPIIISLLTSSSDDEEDHKSKSFEKETEFNECKTDEISLKLKNLKVAAVKPNIILESTENEPTSINTISNDLISTEVINNVSPIISRINPFKTPLSIKSPLKSNNTSVKISKTKKRRRQRKTKTKKRKAAAKLEKNIQNEQNSSSLKSPETEIELPSAGKRTKINDKGKFLTKSPELIKVTKEKRKNKLKYSKSIKFIAGGIVQYGTKDNNINITDKLKFNEKRMTDNKEYENELKKLLNTIGGEMILKMGYQIGKGLGKSSQGIQRPIEAYIRKGRGSIGKYGSEMSLPTSIKIQEKQYSILKALGKSELDIEENKKKINKKEPGIYSTINYDYSNLQYSFEINNNNNNNNNIKENNYNEIMIDPLLNEKYSNIIVEFDNNIENNNQTTLIKQLNQFKDIRKIINCNLLQLCVFNASGQHLTSNQLQQLKTNLEKTIINTILDSNNKLSCIQFESIYIDIINGCLLLNCANEITYNWIEKLLIISPSHNFLPNVNLLIKNFQNSISLIYHMEIFIPGENLMTIEYLKILENQNPGLITKKWKIYKRNDLKDSVHLEFGITEESYKVLENTYNFRPYLILGRIQFYPIDVKYY